MNNKWLILGIVTAGAIVIYMMTKRRGNTPPAPITRAQTSIVTVPITATPGVIPTTGQVPTPPPPPPPPGIVARARTALQPTAALQHIPVVGGTAANIASKASAIPMRTTLAVNNAVTKSLEHIPVAGKALALPSKVVGNVTSKVTSFLGF